MRPGDPVHLRVPDNPRLDGATAGGRERNAIVSATHYAQDTSCGQPPSVAQPYLFAPAEFTRPLTLYCLAPDGVLSLCQVHDLVEASELCLIVEMQRPLVVADGNGHLVTSSVDEPMLETRWVPVVRPGEGRSRSAEELGFTVEDGG